MNNERYLQLIQNLFVLLNCEPILSKMNAFTNCQQLKRVRTIADERKVSPSYIYRLIKAGKLKSVVIDTIQFVVPPELDQPPSA